jgi:hypothetical protein
MSERWLPVLAAVLGLLGGLGGAAVGGYVANKGQEQRFEHERATRIRDLRIDAYVNLLRAAENERSNAPRVPDSVLLTAEAEVELVARSDALREAASLLTGQALYYEVETEYRKVRNRFIDLAQAEIEGGT